MKKNKINSNSGSLPIALTLAINKNNKTLKIISNNLTIRDIALKKIFHVKNLTKNHPILIPVELWPVRPSILMGWLPLFS